MIDELTIRDLGVIARARIEFSPGFTAVTGETGAGKTMIVQALGLLLGSRADSQAVRAGSEQTRVEGRWRLDPEGGVARTVQEAGGEIEDDELLLARVVTSQGRSRAFAGGAQVPSGLLAQLGPELVAVHGQSDQLRLASPQAQREALDRFGGSALAAALADYGEAYERYTQACRRLDELVAGREERAQEARWLADALAQLGRIAPQPGEPEELEAMLARLENLSELREAAQAAHAVLEDDAGDGADVRALLDAARRALERAPDPALVALGGRLAELRYGLDDVAVELAGYLAGLEAEGVGAVEAAQERRAELSALQRRLGLDYPAILELAEQGADRLAELEGDDELVDALRDSVQSLRETLNTAAGRLSAARREAAAALSAAVGAELQSLAMPSAAVEIIVEPLPEPARWGADRVEFLLRPHPDATARPLGKGASGGELSRVMLALEVVLADTRAAPTFVFDEVDAGVGGAAAIEIGRRLAALSRSAQVIVVTHLAQVAAFADRHIAVVKDSEGAVTQSDVRALEGEQRVAEMARLLSGLSGSESGLAHARELLSIAAAG